MSDLFNKLPPSRTVQNLAFGAILVILLLMVFRLFSPFFTVLLWSTLLYVLISPLHHRIIRNVDVTKTQGKIINNILAAVFALGTAILILIPLTFVASLFSRQIMDLMRFVRDVFNDKPEALQDLFANLSNFIKDISADRIIISGDEIQSQLMNFLNTSLQRMFALSTTVAKNVGGFFFGIILMVFCLFFFYIDGAYLSRLVLHAIPIRKEYITALTGKFMDITRNLFFGYIMVALIQATMAYIIFTIFGVKGALVLAMITFICVFIPMVGGSLVWWPLGLIRLLSGDVVNGVIFLVVSAVFISLLDNVLRPMFLKDRIQLHPLIIFFAIMGGLSAFGFNGLILGPMIVILFLTVLDLFLTEHRIENDYNGGI
ncbi:AI-2E family transporter [Spirochaetia bacterium]|nr:AI-2E family transporter [Spirochaetia bacterium]